MKIKTKTIITTISFLGFLFTPFFVEAKILNVPFTSQAPKNNWLQPWQDACEETSIFMVDSFYQKRSLFDIQTKKNGIQNILNIKNKFFGYSLDENAQKIVDLINNYLTWEAFLVENPTLEEIKNEIDNDHPIIIPVYGKILKNPHFKNGGPIYHMLVISGYDDDRQEFITQEPGTRYGLDFRYSYDTIMSAIHDFLPNGQTKIGPQKAIFTSLILKNSLNTDGDKDGLNKQEEIKHGTNLISSDTDNDGFTDGIEVNNNFSPLVAETKLGNNSLIKSNDKPEVYIIKDSYKLWIPNENTFINLGYHWTNIHTVSQRFLNSFITGTI